MATAKSLETGETRGTTTDVRGHYRIFSLHLGKEEVRAEKRGFKPVVREGVTLILGQEAVIFLRLVLGDMAQEVTVTEEVPVVNTTTASVAGIVGANQVK